MDESRKGGIAVTLCDKGLHDVTYKYLEEKIIGRKT